MLSGNLFEHKMQMSAALESQQFQDAYQIALNLLVVDPNNPTFLQAALQALSGMSVFDETFSQFLEQGLNISNTDAELYYFAALYALHTDNNFHKAIANLVFAKSLAPDNEAIDGLYKELKEKTGKKNVKLVFMHDWTFGHFVAEVDIWYRQQQLNGDRDCYFIFLYGHNLINKAIIDIYRRRIPVADDCDFLHLMFRRYPDILHRSFIESMTFNSIEFENGPRYRSGKFMLAKDLYEIVPLIRYSESIFQFTPQDMAIGTTALKNIGISYGSDIFVCLHVRAFHAVDKLDARKTGKRGVERQNCRNANFDDYLPAIEYLLDKGAHVVRIGKEENNEVGVDHPRFIDYAGHFRNEMDGEFMDLFLAAHCNFYFGGPSGLNMLPTTTSVPGLYVNFVPYYPPNNVDKDIYVPKLLRRCEDNSVFNYVEMTNMLLSDKPAEQQMPYLIYMDDMLGKLGLYYEDNDAEDILNATREMWLHTIEQHPYSAEDESLNNVFWAQIPEHHWIAREKPVMSPSFVRKHGVEMGVLSEAHQTIA